MHGRVRGLGVLASECGAICTRVVVFLAGLGEE